MIGNARLAPSSTDAPEADHSLQLPRPFGKALSEIGLDPHRDLSLHFTRKSKGVLARHHQTKIRKKNNDFRPKLVRTKKTEKFDLEVKKDRRHAKVRSQGSFLETLHSLKENRHILSENHYVLIGNR
jgi:hypothetical protein